MAKKKISGLPAGSALNGTELVPIVQTGTTKRITTQDIANLGNASGVEGSGTIGTIAKFTASSTIGNSLLKETATTIGLGVTPLNAYSDSRVLEMGANGIIWTENATSLYSSMSLGLNYYYNGAGSVLYKNTGLASAKYTQYLGEHQWSNAPSGTAGNAITFVQRMTLDASGNLGLGKTAPLGILHLYKAAATTRMVIDGDAAQNRIITYRTGGVQRFGLYVNNTAESGSNVGSDFQIRAYNDAGTLLSTPLFIKRSTGDVGIGTTSPLGKLEIRGLQSATKNLLLNLSKFDYGATQFYQNYSNTFYSGGKSLEIEVEGLPLLQLAVNNAGSAGKVIFPNGNVGIGTTTPGSKLSIVGLPTSASGLSAGDIWNDGGTLKIV